MSSFGVPRTSLASGRGAGAVLPSGVYCTWACGICSSSWGGLCLSLGSLPEFWGRAGQGEDDEVGGAQQQGRE